MSIESFNLAVKRASSRLNESGFSNKIIGEGLILFDSGRILGVHDYFSEPPKCDYSLNVVPAFSDLEDWENYIADETVLLAEKTERLVTSGEIEIVSSKDDEVLYVGNHIDLEQNFREAMNAPSHDVQVAGRYFGHHFQGKVYVWEIWRSEPLERRLKKLCEEHDKPLVWVKKEDLDKTLKWIDSHRTGVQFH